MVKRFGLLLCREEGQGKTEYIVIVALLAIATIAVVTMYSQNLRALFASSGDSLGGREEGSARKGGSLSTWNKVKRKGVKNFGSNAHYGGGLGGEE
ncbi:MAG: Flp family type IVb pilin [Deltaproteobacteria bacterium]|nr:Flp family type IVb pilin [Deltaproteobacteria bacterium]